MDIVGDRDEGMMERGRDRSEGEKGAFGGGAGGMKFSTGRNVSLQRGYLRMRHGRTSDHDYFWPLSSTASYRPDLLQSTQP